MRKVTTFCFPQDQAVPLGGGCFWLAVALPADRARLHLRQKAEVWLKDLPSAAWCAFDVLYYWQIFRLVESFVVSLWPLFGD